MQAILFESAVRAMLLASAVGIVLLLFRIRTAWLKHAAWSAVMVAMLLLPLLVAWVPQAPVPVLPSVPVTSLAGAYITTSPATPGLAVDEGRAFPAAPPINARSTGWWISAAILYLLGLSVLLARLAIGTLRVRRLLRQAELHHGALTHPACVAPITVGWLRPRILLPVDWRSWPEDQLRAVLSHEGEHVRRRDPLFQWMALLNRAVFWFHPLAWWLERQLSSLAEEACDTAVLERGLQPQQYTEYLVEMARHVSRGGGRIQALGMPMSGGSLVDRMRRAMAGLHAPKLTRLRAACTVAMCAVALVAFSGGRLARAQVTTPRFEVATIKPSAPDAVGLRFMIPNSGRLSVGHATLVDMIRFAYGEGLGSNLEITGGPDWISKDHFDVEAQAEGTPAPGEYRLYLRSLMEERFALKVHTETKEADVYAMVLVRDDGQLGPKVKPWDGTCDGNEPQPAQPNSKVPRCLAVFRPPGLVMSGASMATVADVLSTGFVDLGRPVVDRTGIGGEFDMEFEFEFQRIGPDGQPVPATEPYEGPSIFTALQEQLGLKLESARGTRDVLVVDQAEPPTEN